MIGSALSATLPGCVKTVTAPVEKPVPVAIKIEDVPPAELLRCAQRPSPFAKGTAAQIPDAARAKLVELARDAGMNADQLDRLINWSVPGTCPAAPVMAAPAP
jgi:hypothetical protein